MIIDNHFKSKAIDVGGLATIILKKIIMVSLQVFLSTRKKIVGI